MLIVQPDAYIIGDKDKLEYFLNMDYDYIGAPWKDTHRMRKLFFDLYYLRWNRIKPLFWIFGGKEIGARVGNGGLSLRKIGSTIKLLRRYIFYRKIWGANEDVFFANFGNRCGKRYRIAPVDVAERFSLEETAPYRFDKTDPPFGVHDWEQYLPELKETMGTDLVVFLRHPQNHEVRPRGPV